MTNRIKIKIIVDNYACQSGVCGEHGFSCMIDNGSSSILFDTGATDTIVHNTEAMGVSLEYIDAVVLSHGHDDHSGGLRFVLDANSRCEVYAGEGAQCRRIGRRGKQIGLPADALPFGRRITALQGTQQIADNVYAVCADETTLLHPAHLKDFRLTDATDTPVAEDLFTDEVYLAIKHGEYISVTTGCAHRGILNILDAVQRIFGKPVHTVIGGLHTIRDSAQDIAALAEGLRLYKPKRIICCHCTGVNAFAQLKYEMPNTEVLYAEVGNNFFLDRQLQ